MTHNVEVQSLHKGSYHTGDTLSYTIDGNFFEVSGEFYVDSHNKLHYYHYFDDDNFVEVCCTYKNFG